MFTANLFVSENSTVLRNETKERETCFDGCEPVVPSMLFLQPSANLLNAGNLEKWFLPLNNEEKFHDLFSSHLLFDK